MRRSTLLFVVLLGLTGATEAAEPATGWPQWRGPDGTGAAPGNPPLEWSETRNVRWKLALPGKGASTPIVWGDRVYVTTAVSAGAPAPTPEPAPEGAGRRGPRGIPASAELEYVVLAVSRSDGSVVWRTTVHTGKPHTGTHATGTWASNSAVTDGESLFAYFGSAGLYCLDMDGNVQWGKHLGNMDKRRSFGEGSTPALYGDRIVVLQDHEGPSFITALDTGTGDEVWRVERDEISSWSSPVVVEQDGRPVVLTNATGAVRAYDLATGESVWHTSGMTVNVIPTPVVADGVAWFASGFRGAALLAIRFEGASGDITGTDAILWSLDADTPYTPTPLLYDGTLYFLKVNRGILSAFDALSGEALYREQRVPELGTVYASPVGASGRIYLTDRDGNTVVVRHGADMEVLATNVLDDGFDASAAIVGDELYLRGQRNLYCIARD
jgi:outer membrane protein assembly factor BamB